MICLRGFQAFHFENFPSASTKFDSNRTQTVIFNLIPRNPWKNIIHTFYFHIFHVQPKFEFFLTGSLAFTVGGDTVISSLTPKKRYYFNLCRVFYKDLFSVSVRGLFKLSNAFSFCNFVYWFSI